MNEWFIQRGTGPEEEGPLRPSELLERVRSGDVTLETRVRKDDSAWFAAGDVGGLFEAATKPKLEYFCPNCEKRCEQPPTVCQNCDMNIQVAVKRRSPLASGEMPGKRRSVKNWLQRKKIRNQD